MADLPAITSPDATRLYVMVLDKDLRRSFESPALASLVKDGWTHFASFAMNMGDEFGERMVVVLQPPRVTSAEKTERLLRWCLVAGVGIIALKLVDIALSFVGM